MYLAPKWPLFINTIQESSEVKKIPVSFQEVRVGL